MIQILIALFGVKEFLVSELLLIHGYVTNIISLMQHVLTLILLVFLPRAISSVFVSMFIPSDFPHPFFYFLSRSFSREADCWLPSRPALDRADAPTDTFLRDPSSRSTARSSATGRNKQSTQERLIAVVGWGMCVCDAAGSTLRLSGAPLCIAVVSSSAPLFYFRKKESKEGHWWGGLLCSLAHQFSRC